MIPPLILWPLFQYVIHCRDQATLFICLFHLNTFIVCFCVAAAEGVFKGKIDCKRSLMESISAISKICTNLLPISLDADVYAVISEINYISVFVTFYLHVFAKQRSLFAAQFFLRKNTSTQSIYTLFIFILSLYSYTQYFNIYTQSIYIYTQY